MGSRFQNPAMWCLNFRVRYWRLISWRRRRNPGVGGISRSRWNVARHDTCSILINKLRSRVGSRASIVKSAVRMWWSGSFWPFGFALDFTFTTIASITDVDTFCMDQTLLLSCVDSIITKTQDLSEPQTVQNKSILVVKFQKWLCKKRSQSC